MITFEPSVNGEMMVGLRTKIDIDGSEGYVQFYSGTRPATGATPTGSTLVVVAPLAYPCGTINGTTGALEFDQGANGIVLAALDPDWARIRSASGLFVADCNARLIGDTPSADPEELIIDSAGLVVGASVNISGGSISAPL